VLSLMLLAYVFLGGSPKEKADRSVRCSSAQVHDLIKAELFRQAAALRRSNDPAFQKLADYSVLRLGSQVVRKPGEDSRSAACSGTLVLDLPPGVEVIGGRRSLEAKLNYVVAGQQSGPPQLRSLSNADAITVPLATVTTSGSAPGPLAAPPAAPAPETTQDSPETRAMAPQQQPLAPAARVEQPKPAQPRQKVATAPDQPKRTVVAQNSAQKPRTPQPARPSPVPKAAPPAPTSAPIATVAAKPSFNCRYARRYGEIAVCSDPGLASLDRQMASQFHRAASAASPGARTMLQRSRTRFLKARDSCRSHACVAQAYQQRINEINSIMSGRF
jgi:hypothetical protein